MEICILVPFDLTKLWGAPFLGVIWYMYIKQLENISGTAVATLTRKEQLGFTQPFNYATHSSFIIISEHFTCYGSSHLIEFQCLDKQLNAHQSYSFHAGKRGFL